MKTTPEVPNKLFYKIGEVCEITDTQPYVLRFWESEFPQLAPRKNRSGQRVYQRKDIDTVLRIKRLLYEEEYTIAGARKKLDEEGVPASAESSSRAHRGAPAAPARPAEPEAEHPVDLLPARPAVLEDAAAAAEQAGAALDPAGTPAQRVERLEQAVRQLRGALGDLLDMLRRG
jgi:DNA-binding transcriptional MerR regulator